MADNRSRGGKKVGKERTEVSDQKQGTGARGSGSRPLEGVAQRPAQGQPGGPKPAAKSGRSKK
jgi:hypothetical protein